MRVGDGGRGYEGGGGVRGIAGGCERSAGRKCERRKCCGGEGGEAGRGGGASALKNSNQHLEI